MAMITACSWRGDVSEVLLHAPGRGAHRDVVRPLEPRAGAAAVEHAGVLVPAPAVAAGRAVAVEFNAAPPRLLVVFLESIERAGTHVGVLASFAARKHARTTA